MAALGVEVGREDAEIQKIFADGTQRVLDKLSEGMTGTSAERRANAIRLVAMTVGAMVISRAVGDARLGEEFLSACRDASRRKH
jgi:TetR/AcrR family transcriptional regulator, transcriptional repressor for nem operon